MNILKPLIASAILSAALFGADFELDKSHSAVGFSVKHLMVSNVKGKFNNFDGNFSFDPKSKKISSLAGSAEAASIDTDNQKRDDHLKSPDFFEASKFPKLTFEMTKFTPLKGEKAKIAGNLTIKGVTKPVVFDAEISKIVQDPWGGSRMGISMSSKINRKDFGLNWNKALETGGFVVGDEVKMNIELEGIAK